ncbi:MFS transporter [Oleiharenicola lentus]|uniref:MFS transporter n=1 Tax=Oleiharenicola lentus TaxID=2508720 RepID=A0A4Q1C4X9_9BACT|nr:MFS transporter [Oleiharenicola lentus]RXK53487.1 MFS transporter [Oleiharenicola lentus]
MSPPSSLPSASPEMAHDTPVPRWRIGTLSYSKGALVLLFFWLLWGDFTFTLIKDRSIPVIVQLLLKKHGASDLVTGLLLGTVPSLMSVFAAPIVSYYSDRHRGKHGRRIPFLMITTPIAVLAMAGLAASPWLVRLLPTGGHWSEDVLMLCLLGLFWTVFEFSAVTANVIFLGLINDVVPANLLGRFFGLFRILALLAGMGFNLWLLGAAESHHTLIFAGMAGLYGVGFSLMCLRVTEGEYPPPAAAPPGGGWGAARRYFSECFTEPFYRWVFAYFALVNVAFFPTNLYNIYLARSLDVDMAFYGKLLAFSYLLSLVMSYPIGALADRYHPFRVSWVCVALYAIFCLVAGFVTTSGATFSVVFVLHTFLVGMIITAVSSLGQRLFPRSRFAQFSSAALMLLALLQIVFAPVVGWFLDAFGHIYRHTYTLGFIVNIAVLAVGVVVARKIRRFGGYAGYQPPGETPPERST